METLDEFEALAKSIWDDKEVWKKANNEEFLDEKPLESWRELAIYLIFDDCNVRLTFLGLLLDQYFDYQKTLLKIDL